MEKDSLGGIHSALVLMALANSQNPLLISIHYNSLALEKINKKNILSITPRKLLLRPLFLTYV